jgi:putative sugar O-methyltransferase
MVHNDRLLLCEMMDDMKNAPKEYRPGNYWMFYVEKIAKQLEVKDLNEFRNWICGPGSVASFGGGRDLEGIKYRWNIYPYDQIFEKFDNSFLLKCYNKLINLLSNITPYFGFFAFRGAIARGYHDDNLKRLQDASWLVTKSYDKNNIMDRIEDSVVGNPVGFEKNGKFYTVQFLNELMQLFYIQDNVDLKGINTVLEIGSGSGIKTSTFLKAMPNITYIIIDIPPALYVAQQTLIAQGYKTFTYQDAKKIKSIMEIHYNDFEVICLAPWMIDIISKINIDLFINVGSFQEMEPWLVKGYLDKVIPITKKYIYLANSKIGHQIAKKGKHGVLKQTSREDYINFISPTFSLISERNMISNLSISEESNQMFFSKI